MVRLQVDPIQLEIVAPMLSTLEMGGRGASFIFGYLGLQKKYRDFSVNEYPDDWKYAVDYLSEWIRQITSLYRHRIRIQVIDAQSPLGVWKQIRYRLFRFPAFIVNKKRTYIGWDYKELEALIDECIHTA
jgi:hypothetical protein